MITLICTKCKATLEMDDAFAGGVCRCQYCGTIQTVPVHLKPQSARGTVGTSAVGGKALYSTKAAAGAGLPSSGLDELANVVASSGLSGGGLTHRRPTPDIEYATPPAAAAPGTMTPGSKLALLIGGGTLICGLLGIIFWLVLFRPVAAPTPTPAVASGQAPAPTPGQVVAPSVTGPRFIDIPLNEPRVVYLLDRGSSNREVLDLLKATLYESLQSLGSERDFQVIFWPRSAGGSGDKVNVNEYAYPKGGYAKANGERLKDCERVVQDVSTSGLTDLGPAIREAMRRTPTPSVIVIATAKGYNLDEKVVQQVETARAGKKVKIHTVDLNRDGDGRSVLQVISEKTGGTYKHAPPSSLGG